MTTDPCFITFEIKNHWMLLSSRAPQLENDFHRNGDGGKTSQNDPLRLGPRSFGSKLMDQDGLKVSNFQLKIWA